VNTPTQTKPGLNGPPAVPQICSTHGVANAKLHLWYRFPYLSPECRNNSRPFENSASKPKTAQACTLRPAAAMPASHSLALGCTRLPSLPRPQAATVLPPLPYEPPARSSPSAQRLVHESQRESADREARIRPPLQIKHTRRHPIHRQFSGVRESRHHVRLL